MAATSSKWHLPSKPAIITTNIALPASTRKTNRPILKASTARYATKLELGNVSGHRPRPRSLSPTTLRVLSDATTTPNTHDTGGRTVGYLRKHCEFLINWIPSTYHNDAWGCGINQFPRQKDTKEFRVQVVQLIVEQELTISDAARLLAMLDKTLEYCVF